MMTFEIMTKFMLPPAATFLAFHLLDINIIVVGIEDLTIGINNVGVDQLYMWGTNRWEKWKTKFVQVNPSGRSPAIEDTQLQFHKDQLCLFHESEFAALVLASGSSMLLSQQQFQVLASGVTTSWFIWHWLMALLVFLMLKADD